MPIIFNNHISFLWLFNTLQETITLTSQKADIKISQFMKDGRCFKCKDKGHIMLHCPEKPKVSAIIDVSDIDNIVKIDQGKN